MDNIKEHFDSYLQDNGLSNIESLTNDKKQQARRDTKSGNNDEQRTRE